MAAIMCKFAAAPLELMFVECARAYDLESDKIAP